MKIFYEVDDMPYCIDFFSLEISDLKYAIKKAYKDYLDVTGDMCIVPANIRIFDNNKKFIGRWRIGNRGGFRQLSGKKIEMEYPTD